MNSYVVTDGMSLFSPMNSVWVDDGYSDVRDDVLFAKVMK